jgi:hypothetical protein
VKMCHRLISVWLPSLATVICLISPMQSIGQDSAGKPMIIANYNTMQRMDVYRAIAQLTLQAYKRGDVDTARALALVLNATWNNTERTTENGEGQGRLEKLNPSACHKIDAAMDQFAEHLGEGLKPRLSDVEAAYVAYMDVLKLGDLPSGNSPLHVGDQTEHLVLQTTKMGTYQTLAQLAFQSFKKGDLETAATLGRVLDRTWDQIEENGEQGLNKTNPKLFEEIDQAMDLFVKPVIRYDKKAPDPTSVESAYKSYLDKLKAAD